VLVVCVAGLLAAQARIPVRNRAELGDPFVPRPEVAKLSSIGFHTAMADYYWLQAVQVVGASIRPQDEGTLLGRFIDVVTTLDPWVGHPYRFAAVWLTGSEADVRLSNRLLERSIEYHPNDWRNRFYLGFNHFYYLEEEEPAARWLREAAELEGAPPYLAGLAARLRAGGGGLEVAAGMILELKNGTQDPYQIAEYEKMLEEIETERRARFLDKMRQGYRRIHGRDITQVADLVEGPDPVLTQLPPEPHGWQWDLDKATGEIVSTYYWRRYQPHVNAEERAEIDGWRVKGASNQEQKAQDGQ
jgi:hypothetical protein